MLGRDIDEFKIKKYYYKSNENIKCNNFELTNEIEYKNIQ